jgi:hypothetical protein
MSSLMKEKGVEPSRGATVAKRYGFLEGQIDYNKPICPGFLCSIDHTFLAVDQKGIIIAHQYDGNRKT